MIFLIIASILGACGGKNENSSITGKYVKSKKNNLCYEYIDLQEDNKFERKNSEWVNGSISKGTYDKTEGNQYTFNYDDGKIEKLTLSFSEDKKELEATVEDHDQVCYFKLENS
jgi:hypothetical protein